MARRFLKMVSKNNIDLQKDKGKYWQQKVVPSIHKEKPIRNVEYENTENQMC